MGETGLDRRDESTLDKRFGNRGRRVKIRGRMETPSLFRTNALLKNVRLVALETTISLKTAYPRAETFFFLAPLPLMERQSYGLSSLSPIK